MRGITAKPQRTEPNSKTNKSTNASAGEGEQKRQAESPFFVFARCEVTCVWTCARVGVETFFFAVLL